jgi:S-DNA-T family DNA segregation ATPase FtsK/SpoIIIE
MLGVGDLSLCDGRIHMDARQLKRSIAGLVLTAVGFFLVVSILSYDSGDAPFADSPANAQVRNMCGMAGAYVAGYGLAAFGWVAAALAALLTAAGVLLLAGRMPAKSPALLAGGVVTALLAFMVGLSVLWVAVPGGDQGVWSLGSPSGGVVGLLLTRWLYMRIGWAGTLTVLLLLSSVSLLLLAGSPVAWGMAVARAGAGRVAAGLCAVPALLKPRRKPAAGRAPVPSPAGASAPAEQEAAEPAADGEVDWQVEAADEDEFVVKAEPTPASAPGAGEEEAEPEPQGPVFEQEIPDEPEIVTRAETAARKDADEAQMPLWRTADGEQDEERDYVLPSIDILDRFGDSGMAEDAEAIRQKSRVLEKTLGEFKIDARVVRIQRGPVITMYELALAAGTKVSRVTALASDLAIALKAPNVRIVAPLPGKSTVGIELPNDHREIVSLRELLEDADEKVGKMAIPLMLGKDTAGAHLIMDLANAPHLLLAGSTGAGKSVAISSIICSVLMTRTPRQVQLLLVDPKSVEFNDYADLPHLICPILKDMKKAAAVLQWACKKMDERYSILSATGMRNLEAYNKLGRDEIVRRLNPEEDASIDDIPFYMPHIVIVIDELGELMMVAAKEVESSVIRLAQKARAVGIHLLCATQRPSVDVITGLIKANMPVRVAFQVASKVDSRTILDRNGAELLLGRGDMLLIPPGDSRLVRAQGTYMTNEEVRRIVSCWREQGPPQYRAELREFQVAASQDGPDDDLYDQAVRIVLETRRGSVSLLQRRLSIGYSRAARLVDMMAETGIVGSYKGSQAREVMMSLDEWEAARQGKA